MSNRRQNGEGSIAYREDIKLWRADFTLRNEDTGKSKRRSVYGKTKSEAEGKMLSIQGKPLDNLSQKHLENDLLMVVPLLTKILETLQEISTYNKKESKNITQAKTNDLAENVAYSIDEVSKIIGLSRNTIVTLINSNKLKAVKAGKRWIISGKNLNEFLEIDKCILKE